MKKTTLECTHEQLHAVHDAVERARKNSSSVRIDRAALAALLRDHQKLVGLYRHNLDGVL